MSWMSFLDSLRKPPFLIDGLEAAKKKNERARSERSNQKGKIHPYTALKDQYSQLNNRMIEGRWSKR